MLHGHEGMVQVFLEGEKLNDQSMVFDFVNLGFIKNFLDDVLDHRFIISKDDPWFVNIVNAKPVYVNGRVDCLSAVQPLNTKEGRELGVSAVTIPGTDLIAGFNIDTSDLQGPEEELFSSFFIVDFVPTSENLAKWLYDGIALKLRPYGISVSKVSWNETPKSRAVYSKPS